MTDLNKDKEQFSQPTFNPISFLNNCLKDEKQLEDLDVLSFRLTILKRNISSDIELSSSKIVKSYSGIEQELLSYNNNIENLRAATRSQNQFNSKLRKDSSSGIKGVIWDKSKQKWGVKIKVNGVRHSFGQFYDIDYAKFIADAMRYKFHGEFARVK